MTYLLALLFGYALGSIPFGLIITRFAQAGDLRSIGSGNIGATNVLRTGRKSLAATTLLADIAKGSLAVIGASFLFSSSDAPLYAAAGAFIGHCFPFWLSFKGGKGVATYLGTLLAIKPILGAIFILIWLATMYMSRISSLSALLASALIPVLAFLFASTKIAILYFALTLLLFYRHKDNIQRLLQGTELRFGSKDK